MEASKTIILALLIFFTQYSKGQVIESSSLQENIHAYLTIINLKKGFSGEVLVAKEGNILFNEVIGLASVESNTKIELGATYQIASITKTFTGTLVALAAQEKKLSYQDKAFQYIPNLSSNFDEITIHQLLTHTSGLPHTEDIPDYWQTKSKQQMNTEQVIAEINKVNLLFKPGTEMSYSSLGYYLLATILENVYDEAFSRILEDKILKKLALSLSGTASTFEGIPNLVPGYHLVTDDSLVMAPYRNYSMVKGAGDMYATATDLLKWSNSFLSDNLLNEETKEAIFAPALATNHQKSRNYGYGWFIKNDKPKKYYHGGGTWGHSSFIALYPEEKVSIIILSNVSALPVESIATDIGKMVYSLPFAMPKVETEVQLDSLDFTIYSGNYISASGTMKLNITNQQNSLFAQLAGNPAFEIYPKGSHQFFGKKVEVQLSFDVKNGVVDGITAERMGQKFYFKKL